jgi:membrane fusion protein, multidrug efflux system
MATNWDSPGAQADSGDASRRRRRRLLFIAIAVVAIIAAVVIWRLSAAKKDAAQSRARAGATQPVGVATVATHDIRQILNQIGTVTPLATVTVQTQINGVLMQVGFKEGQLVHKGDFLAQIDPRPYQILLQQYQAQLLHDQAGLRQAQGDLERYRALLEKDSIAKQTVDDQVWLVQQDEGTVRVDQAQIDNQTLNLKYCHIVAPVDGRVGLRLVDVGNYVTANSATGLVVVTQLNPISVVFTVPEDNVPDVLSQFQANGSLKVTAYDRANVTQLATGTLGAVDTQVDTTTGTVRMRALFDNNNSALYPQQFVNVQLLVRVLPNAIALPKTAVQYGSSGTFVYALSEDNTVSVQPVTLGVQDGELIAVQKGVAVGDRVVTDGADQLKSGAKVTVREAPAAGAAGAAPPAGQAPGAHTHSHAGQDHQRPPAADGKPRPPANPSPQ